MHLRLTDVWPETLIHLGKLSENSPLAKVMSRLSLKLCRRASLVLSPLPHVDEYLRENGMADKKRYLFISELIRRIE